MKSKDEQLKQKLTEFKESNGIRGKGPLSVVLTLTRNVRDKTFPLLVDDFLTDGGGQVRGLGRSAVQSILVEHGMNRILAEEGGRTSRGSIGKMTVYVEFLNELHEQGLVDLNAIEAWWVDRVREFFAAKPIRLKTDSSKSLRTFVQDLMNAAFERQAECPGTMVAGAVMQHLVGAKLSLAAPDVEFEHQGYAVADAPSGRAGDFLLNETAVHVTTAPSPALMEKCRRNLDQGLHPLIITTGEGIGGAMAQAKNLAIADRIDVLDIEQFIATNVYEWSGFADAERIKSFDSLIDAYNRIVEACESDPSLRIQRN